MVSLGLPVLYITFVFLSFSSRPTSLDRELSSWSKSFNSRRLFRDENYVVHETQMMKTFTVNTDSTFPAESKWLLGNFNSFAVEKRTENMKKAMLHGRQKSLNTPKEMHILWVAYFSCFSRTNSNSFVFFLVDGRNISQYMKVLEVTREGLWEALR